MVRILGAVVALALLVAAPVAIGVGITDTLDEQVNAAVQARNVELDGVMVDEVEETVEGIEDEPPVFDPSDFMEPDDDVMLSGDEDLVVYEVDGDEIGPPQVTGGLSGQQEAIAEDTESHLRAWDLFARITDPAHEDLVEQYVIFTDGPLQVLAAVAATPPQFDTWTFFLDGADLEDEGELVLTLAHEYAHILTLENTQIAYDASFLDPTATPPDCGELVALDEGCANAGSYWEAYHPFWEPLEAEHAPIDDLRFTGSQDEYFAALQEFYLDHQDEFVTDYAATSQAEDMAESFSVWMVAEDPQFDGIAGEKVEFWNQFPELVEIREQARANLGLS